ncbi:hypothetical protein, partial [Stenotrophomonas maltophilia]|uniref:hypothetical protein n=1 Tax=Stenotrophomonas maltophilia TaxID=40324 RepID=UPI0039C4969A
AQLACRQAGQVNAHLRLLRKLKCGRDEPVHGVAGQNKDELITAQMQAGHGLAASRLHCVDFDRIMSAAILLNWATGKKRPGRAPVFS